MKCCKNLLEARLPVTLKIAKVPQAACPSVHPSAGSVQHLWDDWRTSPGPLLSRDVFPMCKLNRESRSGSSSPACSLERESRCCDAFPLGGSAGPVRRSGHGLLGWHRQLRDAHVRLECPSTAQQLYIWQRDRQHGSCPPEQHGHARVSWTELSGTARGTSVLTRWCFCVHQASGVGGVLLAVLHVVQRSQLDHRGAGRTCCQPANRYTDSQHHFNGCFQITNWWPGSPPMKSWPTWPWGCSQM